LIQDVECSRYTKFIDTQTQKGHPQQQRHLTTTATLQRLRCAKSHRVYRDITGNHNEGNALRKKVY